MLLGSAFLYQFKFHYGNRGYFLVDKFGKNADWHFLSLPIAGNPHEIHYPNGDSFEDISVCENPEVSNLVSEGTSTYLF